MSSVRPTRRGRSLLARSVRLSCVFRASYPLSVRVPSARDVSVGSDEPQRRKRLGPAGRRGVLTHCMLRAMELVFAMRGVLVKPLSGVEEIWKNERHVSKYEKYVNMKNMKIFAAKYFENV